MFKRLLSIVKSTKVRINLNQTFPIWWCPWIHDIGILIGCIKHGFLNINMILTDKELPFSQCNLETHIRKTFLNPYNSSSSSRDEGM